MFLFVKYIMEQEEWDRGFGLHIIIKNNTTTQAHTTRFPFFLHPLPFFVSSRFFLFSLYTIVLIVKNFLSKIISEHLGPFAQSLSHRSGSLEALVSSSCPSSNGRLRRFSQMWRCVLMVRLASLCACDRIWSDRLLCNFFFLCSDFQLCCSNLIGFMRIRLWCVLIEKRRREIFAFKIFSGIKNPLILISIRECMHYKNQKDFDIFFLVFSICE